MQPLRWERRPDGLRAPALVCAFKGWNDAGESATAALVVPRHGARRASASRRSIPRSSSTSRPRGPTVRLRDGLTRHIDWPEFEVYEARIPRAPRDLILLSGPEPAIRWRTFCETGRRPLRGARRADGHLASARCSPTCPHSRPVSVTGIASDESLVERIGLSASRYEGPTGIVGVPPGRRVGRRPARRVAVGRGPALRRGRAEPEGRARAAAQARDARRRHSRRDRARVRPPSTTSARSRAPSRWTPTCRRSSSASSAAADEEDSPAPDPVGRSAGASSSSDSCCSAGRTSLVAEAAACRVDASSPGGAPGHSAPLPGRR